MNLKLLIDENSQAKLLVTLLKLAEYDVVSVKEAGLEGQKDSIVIDYAIRQNRV